VGNFLFEEEQSMRRFFSFMIGVISGALVGAVAVLFLTPESGEELRARVREQFENLVDEARSAAAAERQRLETQLDSLKRGEISVED
jgi:gas vesicle protein